MSDDPLPSIPVTIHRIETEDRITIDGILADAPKRRVGVLFVHGLGSNVFNSRQLWENVAKSGRRYGIGVLALQTRGHDIVARYTVPPKQKDGKKKLKIYGGGLEKFGDSVLDIKAGIRYLKKLGYTRVVIAGHSTGANKVTNYAAHTKDRRFSGVVLAEPCRDIAANLLEAGSLAEHKKQLRRIRSFAKNHGSNTLLPERLKPGIIMSAGRFISLNTPGSQEDVFPYGEPRASWATIGKITKPIFIIFGEDDPYLGEHTAEYVVALMNEKAKRAKSVSADILTGNGHSFKEDPDAFGKSVVGWIKNTLL